MFWRPAMLFFAVAQIVLAFAPILEGRLGASADAHVESTGTGLHHAHDDANCTACLARQLLASSEPGRQQGVSLDRASRLRVPAHISFAGLEPQTDSRPRAPPASV
ncbi:MAG: hypothetical protein WKF55_09705 [Gemmatimonadaceae bacterium]